MHCPNCGSNDHLKCEVSKSGKLPAGVISDEKTVDGRIHDLLASYYARRRRAILGVLLLSGAGLAMLALMSKGLPPFLALLWTCWMFLWGIIASAEGAARWLSSRWQIKELAFTLSQSPGGPMTGERWDQAAGRRDQAASKVSGAEGDRPVESPMGKLADKAGSG